MISIPVTLTVAAACALINLWLGMRVGQMRGREKVSIGDGGSEPLIRRMRAQANFVENAPFALVLILALELACGPCWWLWAAGALFVVARLLHPFGMDGVRYCRMAGAVGTLLVLAFLAIWAAVTAYHAEHADRAETFEAAPARG